MDKGSGNHVFVWFDNDLRSLHTVWKSRSPVFVIVPVAGPENGIAKIMGTRLLNVQAIGGKLLKTKKYDDYGNPIKIKSDTAGGNDH